MQETKQIYHVQCTQTSSNKILLWNIFCRLGLLRSVKQQVILPFSHKDKNQGSQQNWRHCQRCHNTDDDDASL